MTDLGLIKNRTTQTTLLALLPKYCLLHCAVSAQNCTIGGAKMDNCLSLKRLIS